MKIDFSAFLDSLQYMGKGMLGIFLITVLLVVMVVILEKATGHKSNH